MNRFHPIPLSERVSSLRFAGERPDEIRRLLRTVSRHPISDFLWVFASPGSDRAQWAESCLREDFTEAVYRDGDMTYQEAARAVDALEDAMLTEDGSEATRRFLASLLDLAMLCGEPKDHRRREGR